MEKKKFWSLETDNPIEKWTTIILKGLSLIAIFMVVVIMAITVVDVLMRSFINKSVPGVMEITQFLMVPVCYCAMPWVTWQFGHIKVDIVTSKMPEKVQSVILVIDKIIIAVFSAFMTLQVWKQGQMAIKLHSVGAVTRFPIYPFYYLTSIMMGIVVITMLINLVSLVMTGKEKER